MNQKQIESMKKQNLIKLKKFKVKEPNFKPISIKKFLTLKEGTQVDVMGVLDKVWLTERNKHTAFAIIDQNLECIALSLTQNKKPHLLPKTVTVGMIWGVKGIKQGKDFIIIREMFPLSNLDLFKGE